MKPAVYLLLALSATSLLTGQSSAQLPEPWLAKGQQLLFIGDSITHGAGDPSVKKGDTYHGLFQLYLATHHPARQLWTANAGRAGDNLTKLLKERMNEKDVFRRIPGVLEQPQMAFLMYGMNDAGSLTYLNPQKPPTEDQEFKRSDAFRTHLRTAVGLLKDRGITPLIISPTAYDEGVTKGVKPAIGFNSVLAKYTEIARSVAAEWSLFYIDAHTLMTAKMLERQKAEPKFSYTTDRVHPFAGGSVIAFYSLLKAFGLEGPVFHMKLKAADAALTAETVRMCQLGDLACTAGTLSWSSVEERLPLPIDTQNYVYDSAFADVPFTKEFNEQLLQITGLTASKYSLSIDGQAVAQAGAEELARGLDLSTNAQTPQYRAASQLREKLHRKQQIEIILQDLNSLRLNMEDHYKMDEEASAALAAQDWNAPDAAMILGYLEKQLGNGKKAGSKGGFFGHIARQGQKYLPKVREIIQELAAIKTEVMNLPTSHSHKYQLTPVP
jgi:lysophospholipase L1-like esterase